MSTLGRWVREADEDLAGGRTVSLKVFLRRQFWFDVLGWGLLAGTLGLYYALGRNARAAA